MSPISTPCQALSLRARKKQATRNAIHETAFRLVSERGLQGVTVEEICDAVGVSSRTFFNYYPTKVAAAFDLVFDEVSPEAQEWFLHAQMPLIEATCELLSHSVTLPADYRWVKELLHREPELATIFWHQMFTRLKPFRELIDRRSGDQHVTAIVFGVVVLGLMGIMRQPGGTTQDEIAARLRDEMALVRSVVEGTERTPLS